MSRLIIVSNRLPVKVQKKGKKISYKASEGGLATGLSAFYKEGDNIWIGWPGLYLTKEEDRKQVTKDLVQDHMCPVFLTKLEIRDYYEGFSNETLWPNFHYFSQYAVYEPQFWEAYKRVNQKFCDAVLKVARPGDTIWVHDYQLMLLPQMIRQHLPDSSIGFFQHIPFPSYEVFRVLPWRKQLLEGLLGADLIGFHTFDDVRHCLSSISRLIGMGSHNNRIDTEERSVMVDAFPMGIDYEKYASVAVTETVENKIKEFRASFPDQKIIISIDRLDYSKGIPQRLRAYELFLKRFPEFRCKVTLLMLVVPSRDQVKQYQALKEEVDELVGRINSTYRNINWSPIQYFYRSFSLESLSGLYRMADVALVTPMRDGMNLVCKEYVASKPEQTGVLILSEMAGASKELNEALIINPNDLQLLSQSIYDALTLPVAEQKTAMTAMQNTLQRYNIHHWVDLFMSRLSYIKIKQHAQTTVPLVGEEKETLISQYAKAENRLLLLDYDGTLTKRAESTTDVAEPDAELHDILQALTSDPKNTVVIISSRKRNVLQARLRDVDADMIAEGGVCLKEAGKPWSQIRKLKSDWKTDIIPILNMYVSRTPGSFVEERDYGLRWNFRKTETGLGDLRARELTSHLRYFASDINLQVVEGSKVVEIKNINVSKGSAAKKWLDSSPADFILAIGDDWTDEELFDVMPPAAHSVCVGRKRTKANYYVNDFNDVRNLLEDLISKDETELSPTDHQLENNV